MRVMNKKYDHAKCYHPNPSSAQDAFSITQVYSTLAYFLSIPTGKVTKEKKVTVGVQPDERTATDEWPGDIKATQVHHGDRAARRVPSGDIRATGVKQYTLWPLADSLFFML